MNCPKCSARMTLPPLTTSREHVTCWNCEHTYDVMLDKRTGRGLWLDIPAELQQFMERLEHPALRERL